MWEPPVDPQASLEMDVALADLVHGRLDTFTFGKDPKVQRVLDIARRLPQVTNLQTAIGWEGNCCKSCTTSIGCKRRMHC